MTNYFARRLERRTDQISLSRRARMLLKFPVRRVWVAAQLQAQVRDLAHEVRGYSSTRGIVCGEEVTALIGAIRRFSVEVDSLVEVERDGVVAEEVIDRWLGLRKLAMNVCADRMQRA